MSASLGGSEMCIRDRLVARRCRSWLRRCAGAPMACFSSEAAQAGRGEGLSLIHILTLPTICSV
eukprot:6978977-Alexandrium_andersonii.AAC.1